MDLASIHLDYIEWHQRALLQNNNRPPWTMHLTATRNFYYAYQAMHAKPYAFLQELDQRPSGHTHRSWARNRIKRAEIKNRFIDLVFYRSTRERDQKKGIHLCEQLAEGWQALVQTYQSIRNGNLAPRAGRDDQLQASITPQYLAPAFGNTVSAIKVANILNFRLRDMKGLDFTKFLNVGEKREPIFREALATANRMVEGGFLDYVSYPGTAISHPQNSLSSPSSG